MSQASRLLVLPLLLAAPVVHAQIAEPPSNVVDQNLPLDPMPDLGVDWPDMGQPDTVTPLLPDPTDVPEVIGDVENPALTDPTAEESEDVAAFADSGEEKHYSVQLNGIDSITDPQFDSRFKQLSALREGEGKPANLAQINRRIKEDSELLDRLLRAKGYYAARVRNAISASPEAADRLAVQFEIVPGVRYLLSSVDLQGLAAAGEREAKLREAFPVHVGDPIDADAILAGQASLSIALSENGFPFARVGEPEVRIDHEDRKGDLDIVVTPGAYRSFGSIILNDDKLFSARHVARIARFDRNDPYKASDVEDLRSAIVATGLVSSVTLTPKDAGDGEHVDLAVDVRPAPLRTIAGELGYGTGEGYRAAVSWQHRNLFPPEGAVTLRGVIGTQEQTASFTYRRNNFRERDHVLTGLVSISNIKRDAYDARTITLSGALERQTNILFQKKWVWRAGSELIASDEKDAFSGGSRRTFLIAAVPLSLTYDGSDDLLNPSRGFRLGGRVRPGRCVQKKNVGYYRVPIDGRG